MILRYNEFVNEQTSKNDELVKELKSIQDYLVKLVDKQVDNSKSNCKGPSTTYPFDFIVTKSINGKDTPYLAFDTKFIDTMDNVVDTINGDGKYNASKTSKLGDTTVIVNLPQYMCQLKHAAERSGLNVMKNKMTQDDWDEREEQDAFDREANG